MNCCTCVNSRTSFWYSSALATNIQSESIESNRSLMFCLSSTFYCRCPYLSLLITRRVIILSRMWRRRFKRLISSKIGSPQPFIASERKGAFARSRLSSLDKSPSKIQSDGGGTNRSLTDQQQWMAGGIEAFSTVIHSRHTPPHNIFAVDWRMKKIHSAEMFWMRRKLESMLS